MECPGKESEHDEGAAPQSPSRFRGPNESGQCDDGRPHCYVSRKKAAIGRGNQCGVLLERRKLLWEEEVELNAEENSGQKENRANDQGCSPNPTAGEPNLVDLRVRSLTLL